MKESKPKRADLTWGERLPFAVVGVLTVIYGYGQVLRGKPIYTNWRGLDVSAAFVIFMGALSIGFNFSVGPHPFSLGHRWKETSSLTLAFQQWL
jgi:hypothetical protein